MGNATEASQPGSLPGPRQGFRDSLGERAIVAGVAPNEQLEVLHLRRELTAVSSFEFALRERAARLANFQHSAYARVRQIDRLPPPDGRLAIVSEHAPGWRLAEILSAVQNQHLELDINAALCLIKQLVHGVAILHQHARGVAHGALGPERLVVTAHARLVIVEYVLGAALERLEMSRERLWRDLRIAVPPSAGATRFDARADITQVGTIAMALVLGCPLAADDYPDHMAELLAMATENRTLGGRRPLSKALRTWLARALQLDLRHSFNSAIEAESDLEAMLAAEPGYVAAPVALETFLGAYQRSTPAVAPAAREAAAGTEEEDVEHEVVIPTASPESASDAVLELDGVIADLDRLIEERAPGKPAHKTTETVAAPVAAPPSGTRKEGAKTEQPAPQKPDLGGGYPGGFETLFGNHAAGATEERDKGDEDEEGGAFAAAGTGPGKGRMVRIALGLASLVVLAVGGYFGFTFFAAPPAQPPTGILVVESQPAGLTVKVDGSPRGTTPLRLTLSVGQHQVQLDTGGQPRVVPITITPGGQVSQYIEAQASPATGKLQVTSEPAGAAVFVDGERKGTAPLLVSDLAVGRHRVELQADGATVQQEVTIDPGGTSSLVVPISTARSGPVSGWLAVSSPFEVQIFEGSQLLGSSQSDRILMTAGRHDLDLVNDTVGYRTRQVVQVAPGRVNAVKVQLPKGTLSVNALPWAEVWIDGNRVGETPIGNLSLPIGPHEIVFRHPQLGEQRHAVTVTTTAPARVSADLRK